MFTERNKDGSLLCSLCPNRCVIPKGKSGRCGTRYNTPEGLGLPYYGALSAVSSDPIEKKPLYHYHPGREIFSVGFYGCSLLCPFCQNFTISRRLPADPDITAPEELVKLAGASGSFGIAYTYSEPLIHYEYITETARIARKAGLKNVLVTNGYLNEQPARELLPLFDAANIDLKSFNPDFYREELHGNMEPVKEFIILAAEKIHVEVTTLVIPGKNDSVGEIEAIAAFIASIDPLIPLHLSCYYPMYKYSISPTPPETVMKLAERARLHLSYVYPGNIHSGKPVTTSCLSCGNTLITRLGYYVSKPGIHDGACSKCGSPVPFHGI